MKTIQVLAIFLTIFSSFSEVNAKGPCDLCFNESCPSFEYCQDLYQWPTPLNSSISIKVGTSIVCSDGNFGIDLEFKEKIQTSIARTKYKISGYGVYGPRLSGIPFEAEVSITNFYTRAGEEEVVSGDISELNGHLYLRQNLHFGLNQSALGGTVTVDGKVYQMDCEEN